MERVQDGKDSRLKSPAAFADGRSPKMESVLELEARIASVKSQEKTWECIRLVAGHCKWHSFIILGDDVFRHSDWRLQMIHNDNDCKIRPHAGGTYSCGAIAALAALRPRRMVGFGEGR